MMCPTKGERHVHCLARHYVYLIASTNVVSVELSSGELQFCFATAPVVRVILDATRGQHIFR